MPDRTIDPRKRQDSTNARHRRWYARQKAKRETAAQAKRVAEIEAKRAAVRARVAAHRARKAAVMDAVQSEWFAPRLDPAELTTRIAAEHNNDYTYARERVEAFERACLILALNLNEFVYRNCANAAVLQRVLFHEALEGGMSIPDALQHAKTAKFIPCGKSDVERELNRQERLQAAKERWGEGSEIIESLSGKRGYSFEVNPIHP